MDEGMKFSTASYVYSMSATSLRDRAYGVTMGRKKGGKTVLSLEEEYEVVQ
jgi:hypothetical protein